MPSHRRLVAWSLAGFAAMGSLYFAARFLYFGLPLPLPFYVKQGGTGLPGLRDALDYLQHIGLLLPLLAGLILCLMAARRRVPPGIGRVFLAMLTLSAGAQGAYYLILRPVMGMGMRFFQPMCGVIVALAVLGAVSIAAAGAGRPGRLGAWARIAPFALLLALVLSALGAYAGVEDRFVQLYGAAIQRAGEIGRSLRNAAGGRPLTLALDDCGAIPFYSGFRITDLAGLNHRAIALDREPPRAALAELAAGEALFVILVSNERHGLDALRGYERLSSEQVANLGFRFLGSMPVSPRFHLLLFGRSTPEADAFAEALSKAGALELLRPLFAAASQPNARCPIRAVPSSAAATGPAAPATASDTSSRLRIASARATRRPYGVVR